MQKNFNVSLHGLRGFSALGILIYHIWAGAISDGFVPAFMPALAGKVFLALSIAVELFFLISGYLIASSLSRQGRVGTFIRNRIIRIYPAFLPLVLLIFALGPFAGYDYFNGVGPSEWFFLLIANLLFLPGIFPMQAALLVAWTLSYEAAFYAFGAAGLALYKKKGMPERLSTALICAAAAVFCFFYPKAVFFAVGALLYLGRESIGRIAKPVWALSPLYLALFMAGGYGLDPDTRKIPPGRGADARRPIRFHGCFCGPVFRLDRPR